MELKSLSASSADLFEKCPARWAAEYAGRADQISSPAADKGTVVHETLEEIVRRGWHRERAHVDEAVLRDVFSDNYERVFSDTSEFDDGFAMVMRWWERRDKEYWSDREVLAIEVKKNFPIKVDYVEAPWNFDIPFNYIFDRVDRVGNEIEVVDYKTWRLPLSPEQLRHKIQPKAYALAAYLEYPNTERIWVTMDQLRYDEVSVCFKAAELEEFGGYLKRLAERMLEDDGKTERLNEDCKYCVRKLHCSALATNREHGGTLGTLESLAQAAKLREKVALRKAGLEKLLEEIDGFIIHDMKSQDLTEWTDGEVNVELKLSSRRKVDGQRGADILGPELMRRYGKLNVGDVDKLLKSDELTDAQKQELRKALQVNWGTDPTPHVRRLG